MGQNEALFREVNERVEDLNETFSALSDAFLIVCECGELGCAEQILVSRTVYEHARAEPTWFILKPGHAVPDVEHVVEHHADFVIVRKDAAPAQRIARETDPRQG